MRRILEQRLVRLTAVKRSGICVKGRLVEHKAPDNQCSRREGAVLPGPEACAGQVIVFLKPMGKNAELAVLARGSKQIARIWIIKY